MRIKITTPNNPQYNGQTFGIQFNNGEAMVSGPAEKTTKYNVTYGQLAEEFRKLNGYEVEVFEDRPQAPERPAPAAVKR